MLLYYYNIEANSIVFVILFVSKCIIYRVKEFVIGQLTAILRNNNIRYPLSNKVGLGPMSGKGSNEILPRQTKVVE